jgi:hypothetical protein
VSTEASIWFYREEAITMPEITASEYLNSLLVAYKNADRIYGQAVSDLVAAEIRRDEANNAKNEAFARLEEARDKYSGDNAGRSAPPKLHKERSFRKKGVGKANSFGRKPNKPNKVDKPSPPNNSQAPDMDGELPVQSPKPGSRKAPKIFTKPASGRSVINQKDDEAKRKPSRISAGPFVPLDTHKEVYEICKGRSREWFDEHLDCENLGLVKKFYQASFGTKTNEKTKKVSVATIVLSDDWNDLVSNTSDLQEMYIGKNTAPGANPTLRDRAAEALVAPPQKEPVALFFAPKISKGTSDIYYGGHWKIVDGKMLSPPRSVKGQLRQCLAKFEFVGIDQAIVDAIDKD